ncbi:hypothetical protein AKJ41_01600 [candidate division MSBL1 archaeon SCGC-AAA259O05]|uniref:DNA 3'-5' helicase n=1 Tax=candidate division MSBL1 archaeon SCGC-AAA259O05 TaxID=1698271 RepID=A0A133V4U1_9EURY|nr:hypothetical protein AKJ41_01600 [candidate division MSBL1 archaeon SCGC-AAA259O05]
MIDKGYPVVDRGKFEEFEPLEIDMNDDFEPRVGQIEALESFMTAGSGVVVIPPGTGKTVLAVMATAELEAPTLILTTKAEVVEQYRDEYLDKTSLSDRKISVIHGGVSKKTVSPVTVTTYQSATTRTVSRKLWDREWGLMVLDEAQHIPSDVWRRVIDFQATRRLGTTATAVREDKKQKEIFSLIGPLVYAPSWKKMENRGAIAKAETEVLLVPMAKSRFKRYHQADKRKKYELASSNPKKFEVIGHLLKKHKGRKTLIHAYYVDLAKEVSRRFDIPIVYGETPQSKRRELYDVFREDEIDRLVVTEVGSEGIDLPSAELELEICGLYGSRMKGTQFFGRILRPKEEPAKFYDIVSKGTMEEEKAERRREYLVSRGYEFHFSDWEGGYDTEDAGGGKRDQPLKPGGPNMNSSEGFQERLKRYLGIAADCPHKKSPSRTSSKEKASCEHPRGSGTCHVGDCPRLGKQKGSEDQEAR